MKAWVLFVLVLLVAASSSVASEPAGSDAWVGDSSTTFALAANAQGDLLWEQGDTLAGYYPDCREMDGFHCPVSGVRARCYLYSYGEPMMCVCGPTNIWACF